MANINEVYHDLTGVDIEEQKQIWDERGKGYYGEYLVFKELYPTLSGCCKILMNLQIPTDDGRATEIDLLLIHETGLYVFEIKYYKGTIYGKVSDEKWTQYFRTAPNSHFYNPVLQNQYHIQALKKMFPNIPAYSYIVFTNPECDLRVECDESEITVCQLYNLNVHLSPLETRNKEMDASRIDNIFNELVPFSPMTSQPVTIDGEPIPFYQYINTITGELCTEKENARNAYLSVTKKERRKTRSAIATAALICAACIAWAVFLCVQYRNYADKRISVAEQEMNEFAQKFEHVKPFNDGKITVTSDFITLSDVKLENSLDLADTVNLCFTLNWSGESYIAQITRNSMLVVKLKGGSVKEYSLTENSFPYASSDLHMGKGNAWYSAYTSYSFPVQELYGIRIDDISYIKLININICTTRTGSSKPVVVATGYEVQIY